MFGFGNKEAILKVEGMTCHHCEMTVEKALLEVAGVKTAKADHTTKSVAVQYKNRVTWRLSKRRSRRLDTSWQDEQKPISSGI